VARDRQTHRWLWPIYISTRLCLTRNVKIHHFISPHECFQRHCSNQLTAWMLAESNLCRPLPGSIVFLTFVYCTQQSQPSYPTCVDLQHQGPCWSAIVQRTKSKPGCSTAQPLLHGPPIGVMDETFNGIYHVASMCTPSNTRFVWAPKCYLNRFNCFWTAHPWPP